MAKFGGYNKQSLSCKSCFQLFYKQLRGTKKGKVCPKVCSKAKIVRKSSMHYRSTYAFLHKSGGDFDESGYYSGM
jgi:hypothetical protein